MLKPRVHVELDDTDDCHIDSNTVALILRDALADFIGRRQDVEAYLNERYPDMQGINRDVKRREVSNRLYIASLIRIHT